MLLLSFIVTSVGRHWCYDSQTVPRLIFNPHRTSILTHITDVCIVDLIQPASAQRKSQETIKSLDSDMKWIWLVQTGW